MKIQTVINEPNIIINILRYMEPQDVIPLLLLSKELNNDERYIDTINNYLYRKKKEIDERYEVYFRNLMKLCLKVKYYPYCVKRLTNLIKYINVNDDLLGNEEISELIHCVFSNF